MSDAIMFLEQQKQRQQAEVKATNLKKKYTSIEVHFRTLQRLKQLKPMYSASYDEFINRLLDDFELSLSVSPRTEY